MGNVIDVYFHDKTVVIVKSHYQYNSGVYFRFPDLDLPEHYQVHFSNEQDGSSVESLGDSNGVLIPSKVWKAGRTIYAWIYLHPTEGSSETKYEVRMPLSGRADLPENESTDEEQSAIDQAINLLNTAVTQTAENANRAELAKEFVQTYADQAQQSASASAQIKNDVQTYAGQAESAKNASNTAKVDAEKARDEAVTAKNAVQGSADQIAQNAEDVSELKSGLNELEGSVVKTVNGVAPDDNGNVNVSGGGSDDTEIIGKLMAVRDATVNALLHVTWDNQHGEQYVSALQNAYGILSVVSISAEYIGGVVAPLTPINDLKTDTVVTATLYNGTTETVRANAYTLSGTLTDGESVITVTYAMCTTTMTVTVSSSPIVPTGYTAYDYIKHNAPVNDTITTQEYAIITDIAMSSDYIFDVDLCYSSESTYNAPLCAIGVTLNTGYKCFAVWYTTTTGKIGWWYETVDTPTTQNLLVSGGNNHITIKPVGESEVYPGYATITANGVEFSTGSNATGTAWPSALGLFARGYGNGQVYGGSSTYKETGIGIGKVIISDKNGNYVHYLIPASNNNGVCGFYDAISGNFYTNADYPSHFVGINEN